MNGVRIRDNHGGKGESPSVAMVYICCDAVASVTSYQACYSSSDLILIALWGREVPNNGHRGCSEGKRERFGGSQRARKRRLIALWGSRLWVAVSMRYGLTLILASAWHRRSVDGRLNMLPPHTDSVLCTFIKQQGRALHSAWHVLPEASSLRDNGNCPVANHTLGSPW